MLSTLLVGVLLPLAAAANQSAGDSSEIQPMREPGFLEGKRQLETPEVVLQLKYDRGELNRIYLAQFRKNKEAWVPSVPATDSLCSDLCHAGFFFLLVCCFVCFNVSFCFGLAMSGTKKWYAIEF